MQYSSRQGKKGFQSDSVIIRAASSVSKVRAFDWVSTGQMTPAQNLWAGCLHTVTMGHGYLHLHFKRWSHLELWACQQLEGSSKDNAQGICRGPGPAQGSCRHLTSIHENYHMSCTQHSHGSGCPCVSGR